MEDHHLRIPTSTTAEEITESQLDDEVKARCWDQREALPGEPRCVICGRYGEYICDETDDDVCSLECKAIVLERLAKSRLPVTLPSKPRLPASDDCIYVRDNTNDPKSQLSSDEKAKLLRKRLDISVKGDEIPSPILSFSSGNIPSKLLENIESAGYKLPTPVQMQAIPAALSGKSLLASADTGSGKTASYLIPIISYCACHSHKLNGEDKRLSLAMVLAPTRELCIQVEEVAKLLGKGLPFKTALVIGGDAMAGQLYRIQQGVELIIATPGRLVDLLAKHDVELNRVAMFVIDEVDRMLEIGFQEQVMQIFTALSQPQVLMYSATVTPRVEKMAKSLVKDLFIISVGRPNKPSSAVKQIPIWVETKKKKQKLFDILTSKQHFKPPAIVFVASKMGADLLCDAISVTTGIKALSIHGDKSMKERRQVINSFLVGEVSLLVTTGLLGRGIDLLNVRQVIVFDLPASIKEYVHFIGRASRLGEEGSAIMFVNEDNGKLFPELVEMLKTSGSPIPKELANSRYTTYFASINQGQKKKMKYSG
ncbi:hypothetical protein V2J09_012964 [Rumex salicifolius]